MLVTGGAGFIGSRLCERLASRGDAAVAVDNFDPFYDPAVKRRNVEDLLKHERFQLVEADIRELSAVECALKAAGVEELDLIMHLAARAGVRPSIQEPVALFAGESGRHHGHAGARAQAWRAALRLREQL
ncbi:MAG TPA: GDP-mannose 4,6-dehydratase [Longimicrobiaceae bacterium]|nr:GDP-mannose 4,6-dehydratase [Longimicrobiaceae bacterium]